MNIAIAALLALLWYLFGPKSGAAQLRLLVARRLKARYEKKLKVSDLQLFAIRALRERAERSLAFTKNWAANDRLVVRAEAEKMNSLLRHSLTELTNLFWTLAPLHFPVDYDTGRALRRAEARLGYSDIRLNLCCTNPAVLLDNEFYTGLDNNGIQARLRYAAERLYRWYSEKAAL